MFIPHGGFQNLHSWLQNTTVTGEGLPQSAIAEFCILTKPSQGFELSKQATFDANASANLISSQPGSTSASDPKLATNPKKKMDVFKNGKRGIKGGKETSERNSKKRAVKTCSAQPNVSTIQEEVLDVASACSKSPSNPPNQVTGENAAEENSDDDFIPPVRKSQRKRKN